MKKSTNSFSKAISNFSEAAKTKAKIMANEQAEAYRRNQFYQNANTALALYYPWVTGVMFEVLSKDGDVKNLNATWQIEAEERVGYYSDEMCFHYSVDRVASTVDVQAKQRALQRNINKVVPYFSTTGEKVRLIAITASSSTFDIYVTIDRS